ncbi:transposase [Candidatus Saccharibacteria bacterium]|nr:transposase [Candidatus Saccharibacteria bacterium]
MRGIVGTSTICTSIIPNFKALERIYPYKLSREAKMRLRVMDYYFSKGNRNASLTARYFGVSRSYVHKWLKRFNGDNLATLETRSRRPKHFKTAQYSIKTIGIIRNIRKDYPSFSAVKISIILFRDYAIKISAATVGRIIKKYNLFFSKVIQMHIKSSKSAKRSWQTRKARERLKYYIKPEKPRHVIEFDMKHIKNGSRKNQYALCAIDAYTKEAMIHICSSSSALQGSIAVQKVLDRFGTDIILVCDNGSENFGKTYDLLKAKGVRQVFARPHTPKDKPHIENFIGKYQKECLNESDNKEYSVLERQKETDKWLESWHFYRPHQALNYLTPAEYCATIGIAILQTKSVNDVVS